MMSAPINNNQADESNVPTSHNGGEREEVTNRSSNRPNEDDVTSSTIVATNNHQVNDPFPATRLYSNLNATIGMTHYTGITGCSSLAQQPRSSLFFPHPISTSFMLEGIPHRPQLESEEDRFKFTMLIIDLAIAIASDSLEEEDGGFAKQ